jgi:2-oxoisovalerate dehydrogenase E2 component (dihydrolipoyl transacylase)
MNDLIERARNKQLKPEDVQAGTFTLNNTGATGSVASQPIINQPQAAILTTESIVKRPVVIGDAIAVRHMMNMCLSFDHRIIDGMMAGQFLGGIKTKLEEWTPASIHL